jgi:predicted nucleotidyltransferase
MNNIREDLPRSVKDFFYNLKNYLDTDLYFYGSINRQDYIHGKSDIDVAIFTDNEYSVMNKLHGILYSKKDDFKKVIWKLEGKIIYGFKIKCNPNLLNGAECEIAIYNNDFKEHLLNEFERNDRIPILVSIIIYILKFLHYNIPLISRDVYVKLKRIIFNRLINNKKSEFMII